MYPGIQMRYIHVQPAMVMAVQITTRCELESDVCFLSIFTLVTCLLSTVTYADVLEFIQFTYNKYFQVH